MSEVFGYAEVGRGGLGNMLFPWARCYAWCEREGNRMIAPYWRRFRLGPYLRRELDKREYHRLLSNEGYVSGLRRLAVLATVDKLPEAQLATLSPARRGGGRTKPLVVTFEGMDGYFGEFKAQAAEVAREFTRIAKPECRAAGRINRPFIGVHIRRGDFTENVAQLNAAGVNYRIPLEWYVDAVRAVRGHLGEGVEALVFSDGASAELRPILNLPQVRLFRGGNAVTDLLALSHASLIVASGSTFSMWASFLGQCPAIWYPSQRRQSVIVSHPAGELEPEWAEGRPLSETFLEAVRSNIAGEKGGIEASSVARSSG